MYFLQSPRTFVGLSAEATELVVLMMIIVFQCNELKQKTNPRKKEKKLNVLCWKKNELFSIF